MINFVHRYKVEPKSKVSLRRWEPGDHRAFSGEKKDAERVLLKLTEQLSQLQEVLYAEHKHKILIIFQAMDTGGKDGTIKAVFREMAPQGIHVSSFKVPTAEELDHDYLWRIHKCGPAKGEIVLFNRSHYEDLLTVRVHQLVPEDVWRKRFAQINDFERMLAEEGTTIIKFYLNISKKEQKKRLQERSEDPTKRWKFSPNDLSERKLWEEYMKAYEDVFSLTSTAYAPWYIVPADRNWYRNLCVATIVVDALKKLKMKYPRPRLNRHRQV